MFAFFFFLNSQMSIEFYPVILLYLLELLYCFYYLFQYKCRLFIGKSLDKIQNKLMNSFTFIFLRGCLSSCIYELMFSLRLVKCLTISLFFCPSSLYLPSESSVVILLDTVRQVTVALLVILQLFSLFFVLSNFY